MTITKKQKLFSGHAILAAIIQIVIIVSFNSFVTAQQTADAFPKELDDYVATAVKDWELPGIAIAVVKDGKVIVAKGYGVRELGKPEKIDENTIFDTASITKTFTSAAVASVVDENKMAWDDPVRKYIPTLEFPTPYLTANVTIRDLLCHRTDVHQTNSSWYLTSVDRQQLLGLVKNMEIEAPFRTRWLYSNVGFTIAGQAAVNASGMSWQDLITKRFIIPLGMKRTTADFLAAPKMGNIASGHSFINGVQSVMRREGMHRIVTEPAGGVQSSVADMAVWMNFQLGNGTFQGKRILSEEVLDEMHSPQIAVSTSKAFRASRQLKYFAAYGLGWQIFDYRGSTMLWHSGNGDGQPVFLAIVPEANFGVLVFVNSERVGGLFNNAIVSRFTDYYLGLPTRDYLADYRQLWVRAVEQEAKEERELQAARVKNTKPTLPLAEYAGVYRDKLGLDVKVSLEGDALQMQYGGGEAVVLKHWNYDTFRVQWVDRTTFVQFRMSPQGKISGLQFEIMRDRIVAERIQ